MCLSGGGAGSLAAHSLLAGGLHALDHAQAAAPQHTGFALECRPDLPQQLLSRGLHLQRPFRQLLEPRQQQAVASDACRQGKH